MMFFIPMQSPATIPPAPHDGTGSPVEEGKADEAKSFPEPMLSVEDLIKKEPLPLDDTPTDEREASANRIKGACTAIANVLTPLSESERLEAVYMASKRVRGEG